MPGVGYGHLYNRLVVALVVWCLTWDVVRGVSVYLSTRPLGYCLWWWKYPCGFSSFLSGRRRCLQRPLQLVLGAHCFQLTNRRGGFWSVDSESPVALCSVLLLAYSSVMSRSSFSDGDDQCFLCKCYAGILQTNVPFVDIDIAQGPLGVQFRWNNNPDAGSKRGVWVRTIQANSQVAANGIVQAGDRLIQVGNMYDRHAPSAAIEANNSLTALGGDDVLGCRELLPKEPQHLLAELARADRPLMVRFLLVNQPHGEKDNAPSDDPCAFRRVVKCVNIMGVPYLDCMFDRTEGCCTILGANTPTKDSDAPKQKKSSRSKSNAVDELDGVIYGEAVTIVAAHSQYILVQGPGKEHRWLPIVNKAAAAAVERSAPVAANATRNFLYQLPGDRFEASNNLSPLLAKPLPQETLKQASKFVHENIDQWRELAEGRTSDVLTDRDLPSLNPNGKGSKKGKRNWFDQVKSWLGQPKKNAGRRKSSSPSATPNTLKSLSASSSPSTSVHSSRHNSVDAGSGPRFAAGVRVQLHGLVGKKAQYNGMPAEIIWITESANPVANVRLLGTPAVFGKEVEIAAKNLVELSLQLQQLPGFSSHELGTSPDTAADHRQVDLAARAVTRRGALRSLLTLLEAEADPSERAKTRRVWLQSCLEFCFDNAESAEDETNKEGSDDHLSLDHYVKIYNDLGHDVQIELEQKMEELAQARFTFPASPPVAQTSNSSASPLTASRAQQRSESLAVIVRDVHRTYPEHFLFQERGGRGQRMLARVLAVVSEYDPELSYCQGMNFIAGMLLTVFVDADAITGADAVELQEREQNGDVKVDNKPVAPGTLRFGEQCAFWVMTTLMESPRHRMRRCFIPGLPQVSNAPRLAYTTRCFFALVSQP